MDFQIARLGPEKSELIKRIEVKDSLDIKDKYSTKKFPAEELSEYQGYFPTGKYKLSSLD